VTAQTAHTVADALALAARHAAAGDVIEARREYARRAQAADESEMRRQAAEFEDHLSIARTGHSARELDEIRRAREDARAERVAELEEELNRIDPWRREARRAEAAPIGPMTATEQMLRRARKLGEDGYMAGHLQRFRQLRWTARLPCSAARSRRSNARSATSAAECVRTASKPDSPGGQAASYGSAPFHAPRWLRPRMREPPVLRPGALLRARASLSYPPLACPADARPTSPATTAHTSGDHPASHSRIRWS